jgi:hypothetical protein
MNLHSQVAPPQIVRTAGVPTLSPKVARALLRIVVKAHQGAQVAA